jgi:hypothetical protein
MSMIGVVAVAERFTDENGSQKINLDWCSCNSMFLSSMIADYLGEASYCEYTEQDVWDLLIRTIRNCSGFNGINLMPTNSNHWKNVSFNPDYAVYAGKDEDDSNWWLFSDRMTDKLHFVIGHPDLGEAGPLVLDSVKDCQKFISNHPLYQDGCSMIIIPEDEEVLISASMIQFSVPVINNGVVEERWFHPESWIKVSFDILTEHGQKKTNSLNNTK